jgi:predicted glycosyltransferase
MRLLIYSQDGTGLGHLRRTRTIAQEILARDPTCSILALADSPVAPFFSVPNGMDYLKLPSVKKRHGDWQTNTLPLDMRDLVNLRARVIRQAFREFKPDAVLVDHRPVGLMGELKPMLDCAARRTRRPKLFLGLRDILNSPEATHRSWSKVGAYRYLSQYDAVFIYGRRDIFDADSAYRLSSCANRVIYCNYVAPKPDAGPEIDPPDRPFVLVMGGGGDDSFPLGQAFLEALPIVLKRVQLRALLLTGPNMPASHRRALAARAGSLPVEIRATSSDATLWLRRAAAVVSMAGYNSVCEILTWRKKALLVPRTHSSVEQMLRSKLLSRRRLASMLAPDTCTPHRLAEALIRLLSDDGIPDPANIPPLDGAERAAELLLGWPGVVKESAPVRQLAVG